MSSDFNTPNKWCCVWCKKEISIKYARCDNLTRCNMYLRALDLHNELKQEMLHEFKLFLQDLDHELKQSVTNQTNAVIKKQLPRIF